MTRQVIILVAYDGTDYCGFQFQPDRLTIQGELELAIKKLTEEETRVVAASRTDSGVHALGQVASFRTSSRLGSEVFLSGLNHYLPNDIVVKRVALLEEEMDVRRSAISREYFYVVVNSIVVSPFIRRFSFLVKQELDSSAMDEAARWLIGRHDFASFVSQPQTPGTVREVYDAGVSRCGKKLLFHISAGSFLIHQVRNMVGSIIDVGLGRMTVDDFHSIIIAAKVGLGGPTVPAAGLFLRRVGYKRNLFGDFDENRQNGEHQTRGFEERVCNC